MFKWEKATGALFRHVKKCCNCLNYRSRFSPYWVIARGCYSIYFVLFLFLSFSSYLLHGLWFPLLDMCSHALSHITNLIYRHIVRYWNKQSHIRWNSFHAVKQDTSNKARWKEQTQNITLTIYITSHHSAAQQLNLHLLSTAQVESEHNIPQLGS